MSCSQLRTAPSFLLRTFSHTLPWHATALQFLSRGRSHSQLLPSTPSDVELASARKWLVGLESSPFPQDIGDVSFSRSSGPGGQNVNKVNSKAQLRIPVDQLFSRIPGLLHSAVLSSRFYHERSRSLLIQADNSRKQGANRDACYTKLHELLVGLAKESIPGETSPSQKAKVKKLQRSDNEARLRSKKKHSMKKSSRSKDNTFT